MAARLVLQKILSWQHMTCVSQVLLLLLIGKYTRAKEFRENNNNNKKSNNKQNKKKDFNSYQILYFSGTLFVSFFRRH
jgi:hypothetical protein